MTGKVWLVGAGPGDVGLLTIKAKRILEDADVVVYDHLVGKDILTMIQGEKELINVGKIAGHHPIPQEIINQILMREAFNNKKVVRLKGGDPFLFGRGGEELEELEKNGIPFEVIPGVTSPLAVPAYNGIPVTHRDYTSSLHIITGHRKKDNDEKICYKALVETNGTLVFLMGVNALSDIVKGLTDAGMSPDMSAAILQEGTTARQRKVVATVGTLMEKAEEVQIKPPAVIVVGKVCQLSEKLAWYEKLPLMGMRIMLTRPAEVISDMAEKLRDLGAEVLEIPTIDTIPIEENQLLKSCIDNIEIYEWIVFTSQIGVRIFFEKLEKNAIDIRRLSKSKFAAIGEGTKKALKQRGIFADLMPEVYDGESLAHCLAGQDVRGQNILIPRARKANPYLVPILEKAGANVQDVPIYDTVYKDCKSISMKEELDKKKIDCVVFTSSSTVEGFVKASAGADYSGFVAVCIGEQTKMTAEKHSMKCKVAEKATIDSLLRLIERIKKEYDKETKTTAK
ncbi:MAG: uroporphyrinogen-III C-methyltransferase [Dorea sp.]